MKTYRILGLLILTAAAASAQGFAQPVREMEKEARSAVHGYCAPITLQAGYSGISGQCQLRSLMGGPWMSKAPIDKILVIEDVNIGCSKAASDAFAAIRLQPSMYFRDFSPSLRYTDASGKQHWGGSFPVRMYSAPDKPVGFSLHLGTNATGTASCRVDFVGHLVSVE